MKKKRGGRKKVKASSHKKFRFKSLFNEKFFLILLIVNLFVLAFLLSFVNKGSVAVTGHASAIENFFTGWTEGNTDINITKYILWLMLTLLITSVLAFVGFPDNGFLQFILGLIISFLAVAFITPSEILVMLTSYSALGLTLGSILPFVIMIFTSAMLVSTPKLKGMTAGKIVLEVALWVLWCGFLIYRLIMLWVTQKTFKVILEGGGIVVLVVFVLSLLILFFNKPFRKWLGKIGIEVIQSRAEVERAKRNEERKAGKEKE